MLGFDDLIGLALAVGVGVVVLGGVETFDNELDTRRGAVAALELGAMILDFPFQNCDARRFAGSDG